jgi:hypothetical protein
MKNFLFLDSLSIYILQLLLISSLHYQNYTDKYAIIHNLKRFCILTPKFVSLLIQKFKTKGKYNLHVKFRLSIEFIFAYYLLRHLF